MSVSHVVESHVIPAPVNAVWSMVRECNFKFWSLVESVEVQNGTSAEVGSTRKVIFKDGTVQVFKIVELSDLRHTVTYEVIESEPATDFMSSMHSFKLLPVTHDNTTFVQWAGDYSADATQAVIQDSQYKKKDGLVELAAAARQ
ncbi:Bet v1-like protein [Basidiobolus meristosporus CBS 931.73]|uniref:Bet v1-like protein n=1 Tax=Basidiobolus meristosporus CBS 931.73 TaxID=1314790 RepID=A0A1Y1Y6V6_9FUNG|nr:Bet v1-like protein [Basidiobolus meristosporus CBS 931.73]|eukprot:ORX93750.1 Bet v1-like protein [Basidiobolus meristosporus CBS 931.73]